MKVKRICLSLLCCLVILTASILPTAVASAAESDYDYSREGSYFNTVLTSTDVLELLGYELSVGERAYLDAYGSLNVRYETVTAQQISVTTIDGITRISARSYTYVGSNGETVSWTPISASIDGVEKLLLYDGTAYTSDFDGVDATNGSNVNVRYDMSSVTVKACDVNAVLNSAYYDAAALKAEIATYVEHEDELINYFSKLALYKQYLSDKLVYEQKKSAYDKYLSDSLDYAADLERYESYIAELEEYNRIKDNNDNYSAYLAKYEADLVKYNQYLANLEIANSQIKMLNDGLMNTVTYLNRQLYGCIFADLVDEVVSKKDELTKIGASKEDIDSCAVATEKIRAVLKPENGVHYTNLKTQEEKYAFYVNNYEILRDNIILLTKSLHGIYSKDGVRITMHAASNFLGREDYTERLAIFIAQLICLSNALSTEPIMSSDGKIVLDNNVAFTYKDAAGNDRENVNLLDLLEIKDENFVEDIANPVPVSLVEVAEPTPPTLLDLPTPPTEVAKPTAPDEVADPGAAPTPVSEPERPAYAPESVERLDIVNNATYALLISDLDAGLLDGEREELSSDVVVTPTVTLKKNLAPADMVSVSFLDAGDNVITTIGAEKGSAVNFTDELPVKSDDISATYAFASWVDENGEVFDLSSVEADAVLRPTFRPIYKEYGTVDNGMAYLDVSVKDKVLTDVPLAHFLEVAKDSHLGILITGENVTLALPYTVVLELSGVNVDRFAVLVDTSSIGSYYCSVASYGADGQLAPRVSGISVSIPCADETFARNSALSYHDDNGELRVISKSYSAGMITFTATTGIDYSFALRYSISSNSNLADKVTCPDGAIPGETVTLTLTIPSGMSAELYYVLLSDLSKHPIEGNSFVMPYGNVRLGATFTELEYTVKFVSDGKVISERSYKYGETVRIPNAPIKVNDAEYSYTFIGWTPEISDVTGDAVYVAQFEATPLPKAEKKVSMFNVLFYSGLTVFILAALAVLLLMLKKIGVIKLGGASKKGKVKSTRVEDNVSEEVKSGEENSESKEE